MNTIFLLIVFLPLLGAILAGVFGTALLKGTQDHAAHAHHDDDHHHDHGPSWPMYLTTAFLMVSAVLSWVAFFDVAIHEQTYKVHVLDFIRSGGMAADWAFRVDTLTAVMLVVVTTVSALVHMYSLGYMSHDPHPQILVQGHILVPGPHPRRDLQQAVYCALGKGHVGAAAPGRVAILGTDAHAVDRRHPLAL